MYSIEEESVLRKQFWTNLGQYLAPIPSAEGKKINWINYKTGIRFISFKMDAVNNLAYIGIELSSPDNEKRLAFFDHFKTLWPDEYGEWIWEQEAIINGKTISRIYQILSNVKVLRQSDWPQIISFLKINIILLDKFWVNNKDIFEMLD